MRIEVFDRQYIDLLNEWRMKRSLVTAPKEDFPKIGVMVWDGNEAIAAGFLRNAEGVGIIDSIISNPDSYAEKRNDALDMIFAKLLDVARESGILNVLGMSVDLGIINRSKKFGFKESSHVLMALKLGG